MVRNLPDPAGALPDGPSLLGPDPAGPDPAGPDPAGPDPDGPDPAGPDPAGPVKTVETDKNLEISMEKSYSSTHVDLKLRRFG